MLTAGGQDGATPIPATGLSTVSTTAVSLAPPSHTTGPIPGLTFTRPPDVAILSTQSSAPTASRTTPTRATPISTTGNMGVAGIPHTATRDSTVHPPIASVQIAIAVTQTSVKSTAQAVVQPTGTSKVAIYNPPNPTSTAPSSSINTAATTTTQAAVQARFTRTAIAGATTTQQAISSTFESSFYRPIDLVSAAREQRGQGAVLTSECEHINCWRAKKGGQSLSLDMNRAASKQYGQGWIAAAVGAGKDDWRAIKLDDFNYVVLPIMLVASDRATDTSGISTGLSRYRTVLAIVQSWYYAKVGRTFRLAQPLVVFTDRTSAQWNSLSQASIGKANLYALGEEAISQYLRRMAPIPGRLRVVLAPYTGDSSNIEYGGISKGGFAVVPQRATSLNCLTSGSLSRDCADAAYATGQALGYAFGLDNSCSDFPRDPQCRRSLMQGTTPPDAILLQTEIDKLKQSPFFSRY